MINGVVAQLKWVCFLNTEYRTKQDVIYAFVTII